MFTVLRKIMCENENKLESDIPIELDVSFQNEHISSECFQEDLKNLPEISKYIQRLQDCILRQHKLLHKLFQQLQEQKSQRNVCDVATQTDEHAVEQWKTEEETGASLLEQVKEAAETAMQQTGFVYEATSGMYYDYSTGYYYNAELGLYYDGNSGIYYYYDESAKEFKFHSQIEMASGIEEKRVTSEKEDCAKRKIIDNQEMEPKKIKIDADEELEEGECSTDSSDREDENELTFEADGELVEDTNCLRAVNNRHESDLDDELAHAWPPCLRVIIKETDVKGLTVGSLFIITYTGGTIGREGDHAVLIPDISISKHHAKFNFNEEKGLYTLVDLGSRNGTYIDGERMSVALRESDPLPLNHGCIIRIGSTHLLCHMHEGRETCTECEPGCTQLTDKVTSVYFENVKKNKGECHRSELLRLRKKFGLDQLLSEQTHAGAASGYTDRAEERRKTVGSSCDSFKTEVTSVHKSISNDNKGFKMLAKMGWTEGQSIGKDSTKSTKPVLVDAEQKTNTAGLGYKTQTAPLTVDTKDKRKTDIWRKTQQRYDSIGQKK